METAFVAFTDLIVDLMVMVMAGVFFYIYILGVFFVDWRPCGRLNPMNATSFLFVAEC